MQLFEFLMVLVSIIVGLGIASLLTGVASLIRARGSIRPYWVHTLIIASVFLALAQVWWESWGLSSAPEWSFLGLLMMLGTPVCLFLISQLLFPESPTGVDLAEYYFGNSRILWLLGAAAALIGTLFRPVVFGTPLLETGNLATAPRSGGTGRRAGRARSFGVFEISSRSSADPRFRQSLSGIVFELKKS